MRNRPGSTKHQDNAAFGTYSQGFRRRTAGKLTRQPSISAATLKTLSLWRYRGRTASNPSFRGAPLLGANPESRGDLNFWIPGSHHRTALRVDDDAPRNDGLHRLVIGTAAALRRNPRDVAIRVLDVTGFAVDAILGIDLE